jgi:hypothetical protein
MYNLAEIILTRDMDPGSCACRKPLFTHERLSQIEREKSVQVGDRDSWFRSTRIEAHHNTSNGMACFADGVVLRDSSFVSEMSKTH